jgi:hypothetical protein
MFIVALILILLLLTLVAVPIYILFGWIGVAMVCLIGAFLIVIQ